MAFAGKATDSGNEALINLGIGKKNRAQSVELLRKLMADEFVLYMKTLNYHWNVVGFEFGELHKFFEEHYQQLLEVIDDVAERARTLDGRPLGTLKEIVSLATLKEAADASISARDMVVDLLNDHEILIRELRDGADKCANEFNDIGTNDFLTGLMTQHEKMAWMLRAYIQH